MLVIRFFRIGKKNQPCFKIVVTDKRKPPRGGIFLEEVGFYNPLTKERILNKERIKYWLSIGACPSATVYNLLIKEGVIKGKKKAVHKEKKGAEKTNLAKEASSSLEKSQNKEESGDKNNKEEKEEKTEEENIKRVDIDKFD